MPAAPIRLTVEPANTPNAFRFKAAFPAPAADAAGRCAPAALAFGDGQSTDLGLLCAPTAVTWRDQHLLELAAHTYAGSGPYQAELRWGDDAFRLAIPPATPGLTPLAASLPEVALFAVAPVAGQPFQWLIKVRVSGLAAGQQLRLDGGAGQIHHLAGPGDIEANDVPLAYTKPGAYRITLDLLDAGGYWLAGLAESPLEIATAEEAPEKPLGPAALPAAGIQAAAAEPEPWLPYRNVRPVRSVATYTAPGGNTVQRYVGTATYLTARAETVVGGQRWLQTALGDWIAASAVTFVTPSALRGVELGETTPPPPPPPPVGTRRGVITAATLNVRGRPGVAANNPPVATLRAGAEVTIYEEQTVAGAVWYRIGEGRWVHSGYVRLLAAEPTPTPTPTPTPPPAGGRRGIVTADALNVRSRPGVSASNPAIATLRAGAEVTIYEEQTVDGMAWYRIGENRWVAAPWVRLVSTATRALAAAGGPALPLGWVVANALNVRARPGITADNPPIGQLGHYHVIPILAQQWVGSARWYQIAAGEWVEAQWVGAARARTRPASIAANERWVAVCLAEQTAVAYEGDRPVFAVLIASGLPGSPTVQGIFRTWKRLPTGKMAGPGYYIEDVTWTCYFYSGYALHTAYWHDSFGTRRSHGCVNLSPYDAWWIYQWSAAGGSNSPTVYTYWS